MTPFNHFDLLAPYYDRLIHPIDLERFAARAGLPVAGRLLDVGGGTGQKSLSLLDKAGEIVVADSSRGMLAEAYKKPGLISIRSESEHLPFADESFERVNMVDALHHVSDQQLTAAEMWRVTKPGGRIVIEEPDARTVPAKIMAIVEKIALMRSHLIAPQAIAALFNLDHARVSIDVDGYTAWISVDKPAE